MAWQRRSYKKEFRPTNHSMLIKFLLVPTATPTLQAPSSVILFCFINFLLNSAVLFCVLVVDTFKCLLPPSRGWRALLWCVSEHLPGVQVGVDDRVDDDDDFDDGVGVVCIHVK